MADVKLIVDDDEDHNEWSATGCFVTLIRKNEKTGEIDNMVTALFGRLTDHELLMMLRYTLDKMQETLDDEDLAATPIDQHMSMMKDAMLAEGLNKTLMDEHGTVQ